MLKRSFYQQPAPQLAPALLGKKLVRVHNGIRLVGIITETEAYQGEFDLACHARVGRTARTEVMFGEAGHAYVYFTYGMHRLLNIVADELNTPSAVLIRAVYPVEGRAQIAQNRPRLVEKPGWLNGPAKLAQGLGINGVLNGLDLCLPDSTIYLEDGIMFPREKLNTGPRVGLGTTPEPWLSIPWRWWVDFKDVVEIVEKKGR